MSNLRNLIFLDIVEEVKVAIEPDCPVLAGTTSQIEYTKSTDFKAWRIKVKKFFDSEELLRKSNL